MKDAAAIRRSAKVANDHNASIIVVSATYGTTNKLIELIDLAGADNWEKSQSLIDEIKANHLQIAQDLKADDSTLQTLEELFTELETLAKGINLLKDAPAKVRDRMQSLGERMSSPLMTTAMQEYKGNKVENFDVRRVLRTDDHFGKGVPQIKEIHNLCQKQMLAAKYGEMTYVTQGFIGSTEDGETTTLGRGGSDYSAALLAEGIGADLLEIWTDVAGIATTDPRLCPAATPINEITFKEAAELAVFGAKILHPTTLAPVQREAIPVFVGSSYEPDAPGTWIKAQCDHQPLVRAMALKKEQALLTLTTPKMLDSYGFLAKIFQVFDQHRVSVDAITTSEISVAVTVDMPVLKQKALFEDLNKIGTVQTEEGLSLVSLIGNNINHTPGLAQKIFNSIHSEESPINVRMICLGASRHNFCLVVNEDQAALAIQKLHASLIESQKG